MIYIGNANINTKGTTIIWTNELKKLQRNEIYESYNNANQI